MDAITAFLHDTMSSPWVYLAIFLVALLDAFFPLVPSETAVITAGVFAASGSPNLAAVIAVAGAGAFVGDHVSYLIGRGLGARLLARMKPGTRRYRALLWARNAVAARGGLILVVARYIPGGRTAITMTMGSVGYPWRRFSLFTAIAATSWAIYSALIGYLGGMAFEKHPLKGLLLGLGLAMTITVIVELWRAVRRKRLAHLGERARSATSSRDHLLDHRKTSSKV